MEITPHPGIESTDFTDHDLVFGGKTQFSKSSRLEGDISLSHLAEEPGTGISIGSGGELGSTNVSNTLALSLKHTYGAVGARGNIITGIKLQDFSFTDNNSLTNRSNYFEIAPYARLSLRMGGSARGFAELQYRELDYQEGTNNREQVNLFIGATWAESEKFGASAKVGGLNYSFPDDSARDGTDLGVLVGGYYRPVSYSRFDFSVDRSLYDLNDDLDAGSTSVSIKDILTIGWTHDWSSRFSHSASWTLNAIERGCASNNEVNMEASLEMRVKVRRWIQIGGGVEMETRDFDGCDTTLVASEDLNYTKELFSVFIILNL